MKGNIFIVGVGRSGTTLIQSILNSHSRINFPPETHFVKKYLVPESKGKKFGANDLEELIAGLSGLEGNKISHSKREELLDLLSSNIGAQKIPRCYNLLHIKSGIDFIGDKDPMNMNFVSEIRKSFENAVFIHIIRDPRDVIASRLNSDWGKNKNLIWHATEYRYSINKLRRDIKGLNENQYYEFHYEELLKKPEIILQKICNTLNLDFEPEMLDHRRSAESLIRKKEMQWKSNALNPMNSNNIGKWKTTLDQSQISRIEQILKREMMTFSYELSSFDGQKKSLWLKVYSGFIELLFKLKFG